MQKNKAFSIFTGILILTVILGHIDLQVLSVFGLFPYYSFHVMGFVFVSGYFYKDSACDAPVSYLKKKCMHLLVPYFFWNLFYGIVVTILHRAGFGFGSDLSFRTLFLEPFLNGHQYMLNFPSWFVPALFLIQVCNLFGRMILKKLHLCKDWFIFVLVSLCGMAVVWLAMGGHVWGYYKFPGRILFMFPAFYFGIIYRKYLEEKLDSIPWYLYMTVLLCIQLLVKYTCAGLAYSAVWCTGFANGPCVPYVTTVTGILFWLKIAKMLAGRKLGNGLSYLGDHSFSLMMHHVAGFFLLNTICFFVFSVSGGRVFSTFDVFSYQNIADYYYATDHMAMKFCYLAAGLLFSILIAGVSDRVKKCKAFCNSN